MTETQSLTSTHAAKGHTPRKGTSEIEPQVPLLEGLTLYVSQFTP